MSKGFFTLVIRYVHLQAGMSLEIPQRPLIILHRLIDYSPFHYVHCVTLFLDLPLSHREIGMYPFFFVFLILNSDNPGSGRWKHLESRCIHMPYSHKKTDTFPSIYIKHRNI